MKTASLRELQHHMGEVMKWIDHGDEVVITRRNQVVARLVPDRSKEKSVLKWPDFVGRARAIVSKKGRGKPLSEAILKDREERF